MAKESTGRLRNTKFAMQALAIFIAVSAVVLVLEIFEEAGFISSLVECATRLIIVSGLMGILVYFARSAALPVPATIAISSVAFFVVAHLALATTRDISYFDDFPLIGSQSQWKHALAKVIIASWTCSSFFLLYVLMNRVEQSHNELEHREAEQRLANEKLQSALAELKSAQQQIVQQERLAALGQLASGIAHDLNNALSPVVAYTKLLLKDEARDSQREAIQMIAEGTFHAADIVAQLQDFYFPKTKDWKHQETIDLKQVVQQVVNLTRPRWRGEATRDGLNITVGLDLGSGCIVSGDLTGLKQLLMNLLFNAFDAMSDGGSVFVSAQVVENQVVLDVVDSGKGMSRDEQAHCFEPFVTSKPRGSGLGLSVCQGIVSRHNGNIQILHSSPHGTTVRVTLPLAEWNLHATESKSVAAPSIGRRVLYIDDDEMVRSSVVALLECEGFEVDTAANGQSGVEKIENHSYDLLLTDLGMQGTSGWHVVQQVKSRYPEITVGVVSGWAQSEVSRRFDQGHRPDFIIEKPIALHHIAEILGSMPARQTSGAAEADSESDDVAHRITVEHRN